MLHFQKAVLVAAVGCCLLGLFNAPIALLAGLLLSRMKGNTHQLLTEKATALILQFSIVGLGFGMNLLESVKAGHDGFFIMIFSISITFLIGFLIRKYFSLNPAISFLISAGTAICGGSAIAAIAPVIKAKPSEVSSALGIVFALNAIALFVFPFIGSQLQLSQTQFGLWAAIAIHDTSSVIGAAQQYGEKALQIATMVKLERAIWIIPVSLITSLLLQREGGRLKIPYFIFFFFAAMMVNTFFPLPGAISHFIVSAAKRSFVLALFLVGLSLSPSDLKNINFKSALLGVVLWIVVSIGSLLVILQTKE